MYWNCRGFPWHKGVATGVLFGDADVNLLGETWERSTCTLPHIPDYITYSAMQNNAGHRGQGGVACIYRGRLQDRISVAKVDIHHRYIWLQIIDGVKIYFIACCYIPHAGSTFYKRYDADPRDPFGDRGLDVCHFST